MRLETRLGDSLIAIKRHGEDWQGASIDVVLRLDVSDSLFGSRTVRAMTRFQPELSRIHIDDLQGSGFRSGLSRSGYGSLVMNCSIQFLQAHYPASTSVYGQLSTQGDPDEPELGAQAAQWRRGFWQSFGFEIVPGHRFGEAIKAQLGSLRAKPHGMCRNGLPRFVPLDTFSVLER